MFLLQLLFYVVGYEILSLLFKTAIFLNVTFYAAYFLWNTSSVKFVIVAYV